jgi:uncharacterized coiled-coil DUF342 family protein
MTENANNPAAPGRGPETQRQRWVKYGGNVVLVSVVAVLLAAGVTWIATRHNLRRDTTVAGAYSLKPQTKAVLGDLKQKVEIVSLYARPEDAPLRDKRKEEERLQQLEEVSRVTDLLGEYKQNGRGKVDVQVIDPDRETAKVDALIKRVTETYGGEIKKYKAFLDDYSATKLPAIKKQVAEAASAVPALPFASGKQPAAIEQANQSVSAISESLEKQQKRFEKLLNESPPNYKAATDSVQTGMTYLSDIAQQIVTVYKEGQGEASLPDALKKYLADSVPRFEAIRKSADEVKAEVAKLGELKLDDLRQKLRERNAILVMGPTDMRTISHDDAWQIDLNLRRALAQQGTEIKPKFAGEQQITSAVLALTQTKKPKVCFVRAGGPPMADAGNPFSGPGGPLSGIAERIRALNFDVMEKDLSGMWAVQQQMQQRGMPPAPEPSDEEIRDAVWIVLSIPTGPTPMGNADIGPKVADHLKAGGSALVLFENRGDAMAQALGEWGITARTDAAAVHEPVTGGTQSDDFVNEAEKTSYVFVVDNYGDHMLARPLASLEAPLIAPVPIAYTPKDGFEGAPLIPLPAQPRTWGETDAQSWQDNSPAFDPAADLAGPIYAGAAVKRKQGEGRVVAIGSVRVAADDMLRIPDRELFRRGIIVSRFPGAAELITNSVLWLAKMEPMIAISPAAMEVNRIENISPGVLGFWRGVLLVGLPMLVVVAGLAMFVRRRG